MQTNIIQIGNSKGLRLSKTILKKYDIQDKVEIILEKDHIIIKPSANPRADWEKQFAKSLNKKMTSYYYQMFLKMKILRNGNKAISNCHCKP